MREPINFRYWLVVLLASLSLTVSAQDTWRITGQVLDDEGFTLPGVNVTIKGTTRGVITDLDGNFIITKVSKKATLVFSYVGMKDKEIRLKNNKPLKVIMFNDAVGLQEVVVVGYGQQKKKSVVGSINQAKGEELLEAGSVTTVSEALTGIMPGVSTMQAAGQPGATAATILIHGQATWTDNNPLFLVDGVERDFNDLDPNEIESISVLKDASATAVYGVKAANGVVLITTKQGKKGKTKIKFTANFGIKKPTVDTNYAADYATNLEYMNIAAMNDRAYDQMRPQSLIDTWRDPNRDRDFYTYTSWINDLLGDQGNTQSYNINISGGNDFVSYFTSFGYNYDGDLFDIKKQKDFDPRTYQKRYNWRSNLDFNFTKSTVFSVKLSGDVKDWNGNFTTNQSGNGYDGLNMGRLYSYPMIGAPSVLSDGRLGTENTPSNPNYRAQMEREGQDTKRSNRLYSDFILKQKIGKDFTLTGKLSYNYMREYRSRITQEEVYVYPDYVDNTFVQAKDMDLIKPAPKVENEYMDAYNSSLYYEVGLNYHHKFNKHEVSALALFNRRKYQNKVAFPHYEESWVGRATYGYADKYLVEFNGAYNGNENFAPGLRFGFFPSVATGWVVSEEPFVKKNLPWLEFMKIKYSYGEVGSDRGLGGSRFTYMSTYNSYDTKIAYGDPFNKVGNLYKEGAPANPDNTWETAIKQNLGFDFAFMKSRLHASVDLFSEKRDGIIMSRRTIPVWFGNSVPKANIGKTKNHGFDVEVKWNDKIGKHFSYYIKGNLSVSENRVVERDDPPATPGYQRAAGKPIGYNKGLLSEGYYQNWDDVYNAPTSNYSPNGLMPGDLRYQDFNADGIIDDNDIVPIGDVSYAAKSYACNLGMSWKGFSVTAMFNGMFNMDKFLSSTYLWEYKTNSSVGFMLLNNLQRDYWSPENPNAAHPILHLSSNTHNDQNSTYNLKSSAFLRLRNLEIKYKFGKFFKERIGVFDNVEVYVNGNNLYTWTSLPKNFDPEARKLEVYPIAKRYNVGVRVTL